MRHRNPTGDLETILGASLGLLLAKLEKERLGKTSRRRKGETTETKPSGEPTDAIQDGSRAARDRMRAEVDTHGPNAPVRSEIGSEKAPAPAPTPAAKTTRPGSVSRAVRRAVFARDGEQCTYVDADGRRCLARGFLELDHVHPRALGGEDTGENPRVRCRPRNGLYAEQVFGRAHVEQRIHLQRRKCAPRAAASFETADPPLQPPRMVACSPSSSDAS